MIKLIISYDGTNYAGWQVQDNAVSIQGVLEDALKRLTGENRRITASGRTDAGVHAQNQVATFTTDSKIPPEKFAKALNTLLPADIRVQKSQWVDDSFEVCRGAKKKTYVYRTYTTDVEQPLKERYQVRVNGNLDIRLMKKAKRVLEGRHDFKCFCASGSGAKTTERTIYKIKIVRKKDDLYFYVTGNGFLYNMVRTIVGTLLKVGRKGMTVAQVKDMLENKKREFCGETMPAKGLTLYKVEYK